MRKIVFDVRWLGGIGYALRENGRIIEESTNPSDLCRTMAGHVSAAIANITGAGGDCVASVVSDTESLIEYTIKPTRGLLGMVEDYEYFTFRDGGDVYRAGVFNPLDVDGYRMGARWESTWAGWARLLDLLDGWQPADSVGDEAATRV